MMQWGKGLPVFVGRYNIRGYGLGGTLISNLFKTAIPFLKPLAKSLKPLAKSIMKRVKDEAMTTGRNIAQDVFVDNVSPKRSIKNRTKETFKRVVTGKGRQTGSGTKSIKNRRTTVRDIFRRQSTKPPPKRKAKTKQKSNKRQRLK